nr:RING1 and YY1-binding protein isoform X2 [Anser cygnoides]
MLLSCHGQKGKPNLQPTKAFGIVACAPFGTAPKPSNAASAMSGKAPPQGVSGDNTALVSCEPVSKELELTSSQIRKPRINSQLVAQQVAQQYATPPPPKKEKKEKVEKQDKEKPDKEKEISPSVTKKNTNKKTKPKSDIVKDPPSEANSIQSGNTTTKTSDSNHTSRPRLKNVDRSTAQQLAVTVGNVTVIITDFKEKTRSSSTSSSTVTSSAGSEQQNQSSSGSESTDKGSSRSSTPKGDMSAVNDESF